MNYVRLPPRSPNLSAHEVYVDGHTVNPPSWSRWVGWLEKDQETVAEVPSKTPQSVSA